MTTEARPTGPVPSRPLAVQATVVLGVMLMCAGGLMLVADTDRQLMEAERAATEAEDRAIQEQEAALAARPPAEGLVPAPAPRRVVVVRRRTRAS